MLKKKMICALLLLALPLCACAPKAPPSAGDAECYVVTDGYGRQVTLPKKIETIAAVGGAARILTYAGCADRLVGVTEMDQQNLTAMPYTVVNAAHFSAIAAVGSGGANDLPYLEELIVLSPDVIFGYVQEDTLTNIADKTGIPTVGINADGMFDESFYFSLELIGDIMGTREKSDRLIRFLKECQEDLRRRTEDIPDNEKPTVYTGAVNFRGTHGFEGTHANYPPFTAIRAKNVADETGMPGAFVADLEKVSVWDPDIIFLNPANLHLINEHYAKNKAFYENLKAVRGKRVYTQISYNYNWTNIEIAVADAYYAGKVIYPDRFSDIDPIKKADEIFIAMLGQPFYEELSKDNNRFETIIIGE